MLRKCANVLILFLFGAISYSLLEIIWRGFTHWSMFVLGGFCLVFCAQQGKWTHWRAPLWKQVGWCVIFVTACEFTTGIIVNKFLHWNVWDYTGLPFQLMGQICLPFAIIFSGLCAVGILLSGWLLHFLYGEEAPHFHVL